MWSFALSPSTSEVILELLPWRRIRRCACPERGVPSTKSSLPKSAAWWAASRSSTLNGDNPGATTRSDLITASASAGPAANRFASSRARPSAEPGSASASTRPMSKASCASIGSGSINICLARATPTLVGSDTYAPMSPASPTLVKVVANRASRAATTRSQAAANAVPAPNAAPSTAAMTGLSVLQMDRMTRCACWARTRASCTSIRSSTRCHRPSRTPCQLLSARWRARSRRGQPLSMASASANRSGMSIALSLSGRLRVTRATAPTFSVSTGPVV